MSLWLFSLSSKEFQRVVLLGQAIIGSLGSSVPGLAQSESLRQAWIGAVA